MVYGVGFNSAYNMNQYSRDIENVAKYALGSTLVAHEENPMDGMGMMLGIGVGIESLKGGQWLWANRKDVSGAWAKYVQESTAKADAFKKAGGFTNLGAYKDAITAKNIKTVTDMVPQGDKFAKLNKSTQKLYSEVQKLTQQAAKKPEQAKELLKTAKAKLAQANAAAHGELAKIPATTKWGKFMQGAGKYTGISKLNGWMKNVATKSPWMEKLLRHGKGNGWFIALEGGMALFTQVIPSFSQLGAESGMKQLFKSSVKTLASVGGWIVGSAAVASTGAAAGAAIGSVVPGIGTAIGAVVGGLIGMVGGTIGSWAATKAVSHLVGKDELELAKEKEAKLLAKQAAKDPKQMQEMLATASERLQAEGAESEDAKIAFGSLQKLAEAMPAEAQTGFIPAVQDNTAFTGTTNPFSQAQIQNMFDKQNFADADFMAMSAGLIK